MKNLLLALMCVLSIGTYAQEPFSEYMNSLIIPKIVAHDSITYSPDSGSAFNALVTGTQHYFVNNKIDTLTITQSGTSVIMYKGKKSADHRYTDLKSYSPLVGDSLDRMEYILDVNLRDSIVRYSSYNNFQFERLIEFHLTYDAQGRTSYVDMQMDTAGGFGSGGFMEFHYNAQGRLDSTYFASTVGGFYDGFYKYFYDANNPDKLMKIEAYQDIDLDGNKDIFQRIITKNNALNQVIEVTDLQLDQSLTNLVLVGVLRYDVRHNSTISIQEYKLKVGIYPNPTSEVLNIEFDSNSKLNYQIANSAGQIVLEGPLTQTIPVHHLPAGVYHFMVNDGAHGDTVFIKQ